MAIISYNTQSAGLVGSFPTWAYFDTNSTLLEIIEPGFIDNTFISPQLTTNQWVLIKTIDFGIVKCTVSIENNVVTITPCGSVLPLTWSGGDTFVDLPVPAKSTWMAFGMVNESDNPSFITKITPFDGYVTVYFSADPGNVRFSLQFFIETCIF